MENRAPGFENLTDEEIREADHYADTGNSAGLRVMLRLSAERNGTNPDPVQMLRPMRVERE